MLFPIQQDTFIHAGFTYFSAGQYLFKPVQVLYSAKRWLYSKAKLAYTRPDTLPGQFSNTIGVAVSTDNPDGTFTCGRHVTPSLSSPGNDNLDDRIGHARTDSLYFTQKDRLWRHCHAQTLTANTQTIHMALPPSWTAITYQQGFKKTVTIIETAV